MAETMTRAARLPHGITLAYRIDGNPAHPVVMPILGITDNITDWPDDMTEPLVAAGYCVVRHELRDSGHSTHFSESGLPDLAAATATRSAGQLPDAPYSMEDVATDVLALMRTLNIRRAALVGYSYGGAVAQLLALLSPASISALVCLQSSNYDDALPPRTPAVNAAMLNASKPYTTERETIAAMTALRLATNGPRFRMDEAEAAASAKISIGRAYVPAGTQRLVLSRLATPRFSERTAAIRTPTLVLHGTHDPIFPLAHGEDIARRVPGARLVVLQGAGHNHPRTLRPVIVEHLLAFLKANAPATARDADR